MALNHLQPLLSVFFLSIVLHVAIAKCGGYINIKDEAESGSLSSSNYPNNYPKWTRCIWFMQAPQDYVIRMEISNVYGEYDSDTGKCHDGLTITNGSSAQPVLFEACQGESGRITSPSRWLWLLFKSDDDQVLNTGFSANWSVVLSPRRNIDDESPKLKCLNVQHQCPNKECYPMAYRCDGDMDCGCDEPGCDEVDCGSFDMSQTTRICIGVGVGVAVFLFVFLGVGFLEICLKKMSEVDYKKKLHEQRMRERKKKSDKAVEEVARIVERHNSTIKIDVPSIKTANSDISVKTAGSGSH